MRFIFLPVVFFGVLTLAACKPTPSEPNPPISNQPLAPAENSSNASTPIPNPDAQPGKP